MWTRWTPPHLKCFPLPGFSFSNVNPNGHRLARNNFNFQVRFLKCEPHRTQSQYHQLPRLNLSNLSPYWTLSVLEYLHFPRSIFPKYEPHWTLNQVTNFAHSKIGPPLRWGLLEHTTQPIAWDYTQQTDSCVHLRRTSAKWTSFNLTLFLVVYSLFLHSYVCKYTWG